MQKRYLYRPQGFSPENLDYLGTKPLGSCQRNMTRYKKSVMASVNSNRRGL